MNKTNIKDLIGQPIYDFEKFHKKTKFLKLPRNTNSKFWPKEWRTVYYKGYSRFEEIKLPLPKLSRQTLEKVLINRISTRKFSKEKITLRELSTLLYYSAGIVPNHSEFLARRFYPSPGGRYPLETYLVSLNSELPKGIYHYYVKNNSLERMFTFNKKDIRSITSVPFVNDFGVLVIITAVFRRNTIKYRDRGYRHILVEAGHMAQNFYLIASALGVGICAIGGYVDDNANKILEVDGVEESTVYMFGLGKK